MKQKEKLLLDPNDYGIMKRVKIAKSFLNPYLTACGCTWWEIKKLKIIYILTFSKWERQRSEF